MNKNAFSYKNDRLCLSNPSIMLPEDWLEFTGTIRRAGYDFTDVETCKMRFTRLAETHPEKAFPFNTDQQIILESVFNNTDYYHTDSHICMILCQKAEKYYGTTYDPNLAGYILTNGHMLNFSHEGYQRDIDHREITDILDDLEEYPTELKTKHDGSISDGMIWFMNQGMIRVSENSIDLHIPPNTAQRETLSRFIRAFDGEIYLDIGTFIGGRAASYSFPTGTYPNEILNEIDNFFETGFFTHEQPNDE